MPSIRCRTLTPSKAALNARCVRSFRRSQDSAHAEPIALNQAAPPRQGAGARAPFLGFEAGGCGPGVGRPRTRGPPKALVIVGCDPAEAWEGASRAFLPPRGVGPPPPPHQLLAGGDADESGPA